MSDKEKLVCPDCFDIGFLFHCYDCADIERECKSKSDGIFASTKSSWQVIRQAQAFEL